MTAAAVILVCLLALAPVYYLLARWLKLRRIRSEGLRRFEVIRRVGRVR